MNTTMKITILLLAAALAGAQSPTGKTTAAQPATKKTAAAAAATKPAAKPKATPKTMAKTVAKAKPKPAVATPRVKSPMKPRPAKAVAQKPAPEMAAPSTGMATATRKRDPFISPVQARIEGMAGACGGGKRCLAVGEIVLRGVVKSPNGMIAVVENSARKTYFLRENDPIFNGFVQKITADTVVFREHIVDNVGRDSQRDVTKTVNAPVV